MVEHSIVTIHCVAHNLELAVADAVKTVPYLQKFQDTIYQVFKFYYYSLKKRRELQDVVDIIQENTAHFGGVSTTRWLASRHRALVALEKNFPVSVSHLEHVATGRGGDAAKAKGILKFLKTENFFKMLCFMLDITRHLEILVFNFKVINSSLQMLEERLKQLFPILKFSSQGFHHKQSIQNCHKHIIKSCLRQTSILLQAS